MSKCLCVNPDKEEYLDFGEFEQNNHDGSAACNTVEYFLATEWNGDKIIFVFDGKFSLKRIMSMILLFVIMLKEAC